MGAFRRALRKAILAGSLLTASFNLVATPPEGEAIAAATRIEGVKEALRQTVPGADLLSFVEQNGATITLKNSANIVPDSMNQLGDLKLFGRTVGKNIFLNSDIEDEQLVRTLAHEARHVRQALFLALLGKKLSIEEEWILHRLQEADAHVFHIYLEHLSDKKKGIPFTQSLEKACEKEETESCIRARFEDDIASGKTLSAAYADAMARGLSLAEEMGYRHIIYAILKYTWQNGAISPNYGEALAKAECQKTPFTSLPEMVRLFTSFKDETGKNFFPLVTWSDTDMMRAEKTGGPLPRGQVLELQALKDRALAPHPVCHLPKPVS